MKNDLKDIQFMMSVSTDTKDLILKFYDELDNSEDKQNWIESFNNVQQSLSKEIDLNELKNSDDTPHKKCCTMFQNSTMTKVNAQELREKFLQFKKEFELVM